MGHREGLLGVAAASAFVVFLGCSSQDDTPKTEGKVANVAESKGEAPDSSDFVEAEIRVYYTDDDRHLDEPRVVTISDPDEAKLLASFFPGAGQKKESPVGGGWIKYADIFFKEKGGHSTRISVSPGLDAWAEGHGEWPIRRAEEFRSFFAKILRDGD